MNTKRLLWIAAAIFLAFGTANAALVVTLDDPSTEGVDLRVEDQDSNDTSQFPGVVGVQPTTIGGVPVSEVTGISKPAEGSVSSPVLALTFQSGASTGVGLLSISVTDTDFSANLPYKASVDGGTGGTFQFDFFGDSNNQEFGKSFDIGSTELLSNQSFSQSFTSDANPVGSLTIEADIGFTGSAQTGGFQASIEEAEAVQLIDEIIGTWSDGIWYRDVAASEWTQMTDSVTDGDIAAGDFTGDGIADVASIWASGLFYQDGDTLDWFRVPGTAPESLTAGDVTGD